MNERRSSIPACFLLGKPARGWSSVLTNREENKLENLKTTAFVLQQDNPRLSIISFAGKKGASLDTVTDILCMRL